MASWSTVYSEISGGDLNLAGKDETAKLIFVNNYHAAPNFNVINAHSGKSPNLNFAINALGQISGKSPNFITANITRYTVYKIACK